MRSATQTRQLLRFFFLWLKTCGHTAYRNDTCKNIDTYFFPSYVLIFLYRFGDDDTGISSGHRYGEADERKIPLADARFHIWCSHESS
jgi:hypothetical protein